VLITYALCVMEGHTEQRYGPIQWTVPRCEIKLALLRNWTTLPCCKYSLHRYMLLIATAVDDRDRTTDTPLERSHDVYVFELRHHVAFPTVVYGPAVLYADTTLVHPDGRAACRTSCFLCYGNIIQRRSADKLWNDTRRGFESIA
jgi:hypothetical protein